jgi:hypothetical protein
MVYPNSNDFLHMAPSMLDDNVAKLINAEQIENYLASASSSPVQDYIISPSSYHPQQEQQNQRQHQLQFPATVISHSAPNSPPYAIVKTEDVQSQSSVDYLMFPQTFDISSSTTAQEQQILPSQRYANVSLMQQRQQHQQQQQQHAQQLRMQHQQQQQFQQIMYDPTPNHSTVTSSMMSTMVSAATSSSLFVPTAIATSTPFFHASTLAQDDSSLTFQRRPTYTPAAHPAAPKRKLEDPLSPQLAAESDESSPSTSPALMSSNRASTSSRLDKVKTSRTTKIVKSSSPSFSPLTDLSASETTKARNTNKKAMAIKKAISESRESSEQPENSESRAGHIGNVTHPRRAAQNRAAQRTFRNRRKAYIKELEQKVNEIDRTRELMEAVQVENQEVWRRLQVLEALAARNGLQVPVFPPLASLAATATLSADGLSVVTGNEYGLADNADMMMMNQYGSSDEE